MPRHRNNQRRRNNGDTPRQGQTSSAARNSVPRLPLPLLQRIFEMRLYGELADNCASEVYKKTLTTLLSVNRALHDVVRNDFLRPGRDVDFVEALEEEHDCFRNFYPSSDARPGAVIVAAVFDLYVKSAPDVQLFRRFELALQRWWPTTANVPLDFDDLFDLCFSDLTTGSELQRERALVAALPNISLLQRNLHAGGPEQQQTSSALTRLVAKSVTEYRRLPLGKGGSLLFQALAAQVFASHLHADNEVDVDLPETYHAVALDNLPTAYRVFLAALEDRRRDVNFTLTLNDNEEGGDQGKAGKSEDEDVEFEEEDVKVEKRKEEEVNAEEQNVNAEEVKKEDATEENPPVNLAQQEHQQRIEAPRPREPGLDEDITRLKAAADRMQRSILRRHDRRGEENFSVARLMNEVQARMHGYDPRDLAAEGLTMADVLDPLQGRMDSHDDDWYRRMDQMTNGGDYDDVYGYGGGDYDGYSYY